MSYILLLFLAAGAQNAHTGWEYFVCDRFLAKKLFADYVPVYSPSEKSIRYAENMKSLGVPIRQQINYAEWKDEIMWDLAEIPTRDFYSRYPHAKELMGILTSKNNTNLRKEIEDWSERFIKPRGFRIVWFKDLENVVRHNPRLSQVDAELKLKKHKGVSPSGAINTHLYFEMIDQGILPIGDDHDLRSHLVLFSFPDIAKTTQRLARLYIKLQSTQVERLPGAVEHLWHGVQEHLTDLRVESGKVSYSVLGGYSHVLASVFAFSDLSDSTNISVFSPVTRLRYLDSVTELVFNEIMSGNPSREATALHKVLTEELHLKNAESDYEGDKDLINSAKRNIFIPERNTHGLRPAWIKMGEWLAAQTSPAIRAFSHRENSLRIWNLYIDYLETFVRNKKLK